MALPRTTLVMMGSQPSSIFLGIEASCFNFFSLIFIRALVMCSVKAKFWELVWGLSASFCKNLITSELLQSSKSIIIKGKRKIVSHTLKKFSTSIRNMFNCSKHFCRRSGFSFINYFTNNSRRYNSI